LSDSQNSISVLYHIPLPPKVSLSLSTTQIHVKVVDYLVTDFENWIDFASSYVAGLWLQSQGFGRANKFLGCLKAARCQIINILLNHLLLLRLCCKDARKESHSFVSDAANSFEHYPPLNKNFEFFLCDTHTFNDLWEYIPNKLLCHSIKTCYCHDQHCPQKILLFICSHTTPRTP